MLSPTLRAHRHHFHDAEDSANGDNAGIADLEKGPNESNRLLVEL